MTPEREAQLRARAADALTDPKRLSAGSGASRLPPARSRPCPDCGAAKDKPCLNARTGRPITTLHRGRVRSSA